MLIGPGAEAFARREGLEAVDASYFHTDRRWTQLQRAKERAAAGGARARPNVLGEDDGPVASQPPASAAAPGPGDAADLAGTVGAVALDPDGRLAAATSTGGMANKRSGRVGDSPIIGAGTYAGPRCAVSCTGWGEYFIRNAVAHDVHARMEHGSRSLAEATREVIFEKLEAQVPASGGLVAIDRDGNVELSFSTPGMYRGWVDGNGNATVAIYRED
jgi:beta-aspartyl-peptidase (threonine type)